MKSAHFLVVALFMCIWMAAGGSSCAYRVPYEKPVRISGYVLDAVSRQPVPGVLVANKGYGSLYGPSHTDLNGRFVLYVPPSRRKDDEWLTGQTVLYEGRTAVLYEGRVAIPVDDSQPATILLKRSGAWLKSYGCLPKDDTVHRSQPVKMPIQGFPGSQFAFLIRDTSAYTPYKLRAITFMTSLNGFVQEPMRLRIYQYYDNPALPPTEDILLENIIMCPERKEGFNTFDVNKYDIMVPAKGFFLAFEYVVGGDKFYCTDPVIGYTPTGPILRPPCARPDIRTWEYVIGKGWHRATAVENCWPLYESAISVEVEPAPAKR